MVFLDDIAGKTSMNLHDMNFFSDSGRNLHAIFSLTRANFGRFWKQFGKILRIFVLQIWRQRLQSYFTKFCMNHGKFSMPVSIYYMQSKIVMVITCPFHGIAIVTPKISLGIYTGLYEKNGVFNNLLIIFVRKNTTSKRKTEIKCWSLKTNNPQLKP